MTLDEKIDLVLTRFGDQQLHDFWSACDDVLNEDSVAHDIEHEVIREEMVREDLIGLKGERAFQITSKGMRILGSGGWLKYCQYLVTNANESKNQSKRESQLQTRVARDNRIFGYGGLIITLVGVVLTWLTIHLTNKTEEYEQKIKKLMKEKDSLSQVMDSSESLLKTREIEIDVLRQKIDSLTNPPKHK